MPPVMVVFCQLYCNMWLRTELSACLERSSSVLKTHCWRTKLENDRGERRDEIEKQVVADFNCYMRSHLNLIS